MIDIEQMLDDYRFSAMPAKGRKKIVDYVHGLEQEIAKLTGELNVIMTNCVVTGHEFLLPSNLTKGNDATTTKEVQTPLEPTLTNVTRVTRRRSSDSTTQRKARK